jgi:hypothetical protein
MTVSSLIEEWKRQGAVDPSKWPVEPYTRPPLSNDTTVKYAPLVEIDLSNWDVPGERQRLADQLHHAVRDVGFYIVKGHGITDEEILEILAIGNTFLHLSLEEKRKNPTNVNAGQTFGYREPTHYFGQTGIKDTLEMVYQPDSMLMPVRMPQRSCRVQGSSYSSIHPCSLG